MRWLFVLALVACSKKDPGPTCDQVVDHMLDVTKQRLPGHDDTSFGSQKKAMVTSCESRNWTADVRTCLVAAQSISDIAKCRGGRTDILERPRRPRVGSGSGSGSAAAPTVHPPISTGSST